MPPSATTGTGTARAMAAKVARGRVRAPGCERVAYSGEAKSSRAPARTAARAWGSEWTLAVSMGRAR
jgi:hypothetical protein